MGFGSMVNYLLFSPFISLLLHPIQIQDITKPLTFLNKVGRILLWQGRVIHNCKCLGQKWNDISSIYVGTTEDCTEDSSRYCHPCGLTCFSNLTLLLLFVFVFNKKLRKYFSVVEINPSSSRVAWYLSFTLGSGHS